MSKRDEIDALRDEIRELREEIRALTAAMVAAAASPQVVYIQPTPAPAPVWQPPFTPYCGDAPMLGIETWHQLHT